MSLSKSENIRKVTGFTLEEMLAMSSMDFCLKVSVLQAKNLKRVQHDWLVQQRKLSKVDNTQVKELLDVIDGEVI